MDNVLASGMISGYGEGFSVPAGTKWAAVRFLSPGDYHGTGTLDGKSWIVTAAGESFMISSANGLSEFGFEIGATGGAFEILYLEAAA
jgi:hypothetical protein